MTNHDMQEDDYEGDILTTHAEAIMRELIEMTRRLSRRGYGRTELIFSDDSAVTVADSVMRVVDLLRDRHRPLGFIAPDRESKRDPFIQAWEIGDHDAHSELVYRTRWLFVRLLLARTAQRELPAQAQGASRKAVAAATTAPMTAEGK
jgi:hypothetical protein